MDLDTIKTYGINIFAFSINLTNFDEIIKSTTLVVALVYTLFKALNEYKRWKTKKRSNGKSNK